jgi:hypothetical protein
MGYKSILMKALYFEPVIRFLEAFASAQIEKREHFGRIRGKGSNVLEQTGFSSSSNCPSRWPLGPKWSRRPLRRLRHSSLGLNLSLPMKNVTIKSTFLYSLTRALTRGDRYLGRVRALPRVGAVARDGVERLGIGLDEPVQNRIQSIHKLVHFNHLILCFSDIMCPLFVCESRAEITRGGVVITQKTLSETISILTESIFCGL